MTVIAGLVDGAQVVIGGDSAGIAGYQLTVRRDSKVFVNGPYVFGFCGSFRMGQIIRYGFTPPAPPGTADLEAHMCTEFVDALRAALREGGWARIEQAQEQGGTFLVGTRGRLFRVDGDFQVGEALDGFDAIGCGDDVALGALFATAENNMSADERIMLALRAAERSSAGVRGPFSVAREGGG